MIEEVKISIIMPIYNKSSYLHETLDSLLNQIFQCYEIVCINDGSTDSSLQILEAYSAKDKRIRVFNNEKNIGAALSRNRGIEYAKAPYILFLDADDIFDPMLLEEAFSAAESYDTDIVVWENDTFTDSDLIFKESGSKGEQYYSDIFCNKIFNMNDLAAENVTLWSISVWDKLYRKQFILDNYIHFQDIKSANDGKFALISILLANRIIHVKTYRALLHYRVKIADQISTNRNPMNMYFAYKEVRRELLQHGLWEKYYSKCAIYFCISMLWELRNDNGKKGEETYIFLQKDGMRELDFTEWFEHNEDIKPCYKELYHKIMKEKYQTKWFLKYSYFEIFLNSKENLLVKFCQMRMEQNNRYALWGMGQKSKMLLLKLKELGVKIDYLIDQDVAKQETKFYEQKIDAFEDVFQEIDVVIVMSRIHIDEICDRVKNKSKKIMVFSLFAYLEGRKELEDCFI